MKVTSAAANKMIRELNNQIDMLRKVEDQSEKFNCSVGENPEDVRPEYSFYDTQEKLWDLEDQVRKLKHAVNVFNTTTFISKFNMTIDQILIWMPQLSQRIAKLEKMASRIPKIRVSQYGSNIVDYQIINYDLEEISKELEKHVKLLNNVQNELDIINNTKKFEV